MRRTKGARIINMHTGVVLNDFDADLAKLKLDVEAGLAASKEYVDEQDAATLASANAHTDAREAATKEYVDARTSGPYVTDAPIIVELTNDIRCPNDHPPGLTYVRRGQTLYEFVKTDSGQQITVVVPMKPEYDLTRPVTFKAQICMKVDPAPWNTVHWCMKTWCTCMPDGSYTNYNSRETYCMPAVSQLTEAFGRATYTLDSFIPSVALPGVEVGGENGYINFLLLRATGGNGTPEVTDTLDQQVYLCRLWMEVYQKHTA